MTWITQRSKRNLFRLVFIPVLLCTLDLPIATVFIPLAQYVSQTEDGPIDLSCVKFWIANIQSVTGRFGHKP